MKAFAFRALLLAAQLAGGCAHLEQPSIDALTIDCQQVFPPQPAVRCVQPGAAWMPAPLTITEEIPDSALPSTGLAETLAQGTLNVLGSFVHHAVDRNDRHHTRTRTVVVAPAPVARPTSQTRVQRPRPQKEPSRARHEHVKRKPAVNKSSSAKSSKKKK